MIIIALIGKERVGKDTFADYLCHNYKFEKYNLAKPIKEIAKIMFGWNDTMLEGNEKDIVDPNLGIKPRDFYTWFGTEICQFNLHQKFPELKIPHRSIWSLSMDKWIQSMVKNDKQCRIIIPDVRFCHEVEVLKKYNTIFIHLEKDNKSNIGNNIANKSNNKYELDKILENTTISYNIKNNSTLDDYYLKIHNFIKHIILHEYNVTTYDLTNNYSLYI